MRPPHGPPEAEARPRERLTVTYGNGAHDDVRTFWIFLQMPHLLVILYLSLTGFYCVF